jgi:hypothetical protein
MFPKKVIDVIFCCRSSTLQHIHLQKSAVKSRRTKKRFNLFLEEFANAF